MKIGAIVLAGLASADEERKVPPRHPLQRLNRLVEFSGEILNSGPFNNHGSEGWIDNWVRKFSINGDRMEKAFTRGQQRCGYYDNENLPHGGPASHNVQRRDIDDIRYNREDPCTGVKQIMTGFTKWTLRYISQCYGQRENAYQFKRLGRWHKVLNSALNCPEHPKSSTIILNSGSIIDAITVDGYKVGGNGGPKYEIELGIKEKVTAIEYGYVSYNTHYWPTGSLCSFTIFTNIDDYGPYSRRDRCKDIKRIEIPAGMSFQKFLKKNAEATNGGQWGGTGVTINRN